MPQNDDCNYSICFTRTARKELQNVDNIIALKIISKIELLQSNPRPHGCKKLIGQNALWRIRVGEYRVVYTIDDRDYLIEIMIVRHRSNVYKDLT
jgi:mRNA interferase RelE/StbE